MSSSSVGSKRAAATAFHSVTLAVALIAGLVTFGTVAVMLSASGMFLGWVAYSINSHTVRDGYANLVCFLLGLGLGIGTTVVINLLTPALGLAATGLAIFVLVALVMSLRKLAPINNPLAYFLGITSFFYSQLPPIPSSFATLATAAALGATGAAISSYFQVRLLRPGVPTSTEAATTSDVKQPQASKG
jgi:hypothetical protein